MIKRPKRGESEEDILRMQEQFLKEKAKDNSLQPAAQVVNLRHKEPQQTKHPTCNQQEVRKPSKYAKSKGLKYQDQTFSNSTSIVGDIYEKNTDDVDQKNIIFNDDKVYYPDVIPAILGGIVEKKYDEDIDFNFEQMPLKGFPEVTKASFYSEIVNKNCSSSDVSVDKSNYSINENSFSNDKPRNLPSKSYIINNSDAKNIHIENINLLSKMSEKEILQEKQKLLSSLEPKLVEFLKSSREKASSSHVTSMKSSIQDNSENQLNVKETDVDETLWENDVLSHPNINKWMHFDTLEKDKLKWMEAIKESEKMEPDKPYEARFDFNGYLLPYTVDYSEDTKTLFHHAEEPHRPGYSLSELFELCRSTVTQQRVLAFNIIAGILESYIAGIYKNVLELPLSKLFFVIRIGMDENKTILLEPALKAMRNLVYNRIDEACLDALIGLEESFQQPCLENDLSEIDELDSKESELKDYHLAEIDIITALLRTDILQRIYYILETIRPSFNCVQYSLQILTRLARNSVETTLKIVENEYLMKTLIKNFIPVTSINFKFEPQIVYNGKPILAALKLFRVLTLQSREINEVISKHEIVRPLSEYVSSIVEGSYGLRIQTESYCILSNLMYFENGIDTAELLTPIIATTLYKHVQGTDFFIETSVISITHAASVLQYINKTLCVTSNSLINFRQKICPLLYEGLKKWLTQVSEIQYYTFGHLKLLCATFDCCRTLVISESNTPAVLLNCLSIFPKTRGCRILASYVLSSSNLISVVEEKDIFSIKNLTGLGGSFIGTEQKVLPIMNTMSTIPFFSSLLKLLYVIHNDTITEDVINKMLEYLREVTVIRPGLCNNWFTRIETDFLFNIIRLAVKTQIPELQKDLLYKSTNKLSYLLNYDKSYELDFLLDNIIFNKHWFTTDRLMNLMSLNESEGFSTALSSIGEIRACYCKYINLNKSAKASLMVTKWRETILPRDWIYLPILNLYSISQDSSITQKIVGEHAKKVAAQKSAEKEFVIRCSLNWILFNEICFPDLLVDMSLTDRFCRIMCVFLCDNSLFLDVNIKPVLQKCIQSIFRKERQMPFNFDKKLIGLNNFQDFYTQFLEQFQSVSYGDPTFAACVLVPLAQRHDVKWRKILWSEYAGCLRAVDCPEHMLCYSLQEYLYPEETDESLLKCYFRALNSNLLRPNTIAYIIADHHVKCFQEKQNLLPI